ncbi:MAG: helix-turn-helix transcriptional regulator [Sneathiellales bacterium]|nr:helix-turn-helix transcriptional regulator [Sneathiellales bacterium]
MQQEPTLASYTHEDFVKRPIALRVYQLEESGIAFAPHHHDWAQLAYTSEGIVVVTTEQGRWLVPPHHAVWIPAQKTHSISIRSAAKFIVIHIDASRMTRMSNDCGVLSVSPLLKELIATAEAVPRDYDPDTPEARLMSVILDQVQTAETAPLLLPLPTDERLLKLTSILMEDASEKRSLEELANSIGGSARNLSRLFKNETGMTFGKWRQQRRLMAAIEMLAEGKSITNIALDLGYDSVSAFISMFRQMMGVTPSRYFKSVHS